MILTNQQALEVFERRVSVRHYDPNKKISEQDFATILEFARRSPSSVGSEPWKFLVIQNPALRAKIKPFAWGMQSSIDDASYLVIILAKKHARYDSDFFADVMARRGFTDEQRQKALAKYKSFQTIDMPIADDERKLFDWAGKQTYIALANMMTGAAMLGIDSCPIEGMHYEQVSNILVEEGLLDPEDYGLSVAVTFGYRAAEIKPKERKALEEIVQWA
ncbi:NAD(P)H-dependent oxidoreductase [Pasteurellaceae bacterium 15-036681]|nr:NAD(P)H-dependent oxidoreductase [Pasteurellaceae bacterium 15-036681]